MPAHTTVASYTGATYAISAALPATYDAAGYGATTMTYTEIGKVETFPEYGSEREVKKYTPIKGSTEYSKGTPDNGSGPIVVGDMPGDAGQVILKAAEASPNPYSFKITYADGEIHYLSALVSSWKMNQASQGEFMKRTAMLNFNRDAVVVAAS